MKKLCLAALLAALFTSSQAADASGPGTSFAVAGRKTTTPMPEPACIAAMLASLCAVRLARRRRRRAYALLVPTRFATPLGTRMAFRTPAAMPVGLVLADIGTMGPE